MTGRKRQPALDVDAIATELARVILGGEDDARVEWRGDRRAFRVRRVTFGEKWTAKRTMEGRAKRFWRSLSPSIASQGWQLEQGGWCVRGWPFRGAAAHEFDKLSPDDQRTARHAAERFIGKKGRRPRLP